MDPLIPTNNPLPQSYMDTDILTSSAIVPPSQSYSPCQYGGLQISFINGTFVPHPRVNPIRPVGVGTVPEHFQIVPELVPHAASVPPSAEPDRKSKTLKKPTLRVAVFEKNVRCVSVQVHSALCRIARDTPGTCPVPPEPLLTRLKGIVDGIYKFKRPAETIKKICQDPDLADYMRELYTHLMMTVKEHKMPHIRLDAEKTYVTFYDEELLRLKEFVDLARANAKSAAALAGEKK